MQNRDEYFMSLALSEAKKAWGNTHPNPMVGAVIVEDNKVVATGYHEKDGFPHAERVALKNLNRKAKQGSKIYVSLEPCSTEGRTGSCTKAIIESGISEVIIGTLDPNPKHAGKAISILKDANISVKTGVLEEECKNLNIIFNHIITKKESLLCAKFAITKDLKIAQAKGIPLSISGTKSREHLMQLRQLFDSIAVGFNTFIADNPKLNIRQAQEDCHYRLLFDRNLNCLKHLDKNLFSDTFKEKTIIIGNSQSPKSKIKELENLNLKYIILNDDKQNPPSFWKELKKELYQRNIYSVLIEGGLEILNSLFDSKQADYFFVYQSPNLAENASYGFKKHQLEFTKNAHSKKLDMDTLYFGEF